ncbi:hypothetical protein ABH930_007264 [Kitasatospora sp. GAS204A]|nr:hypothetical protein [Kitasatospora sp. GAS204B]
MTVQSIPTGLLLPVVTPQARPVSLARPLASVTHFPFPGPLRSEGMLTLIADRRRGRESALDGTRLRIPCRRR